MRPTVRKEITCSITAEVTRPEVDLLVQADPPTTLRPPRTRLAFPKKTCSWFLADGRTPAGNMFRKIQEIHSFSRVQTASTPSGSVLVNLEASLKVCKPRRAHLLVIANSRHPIQDSSILERKYSFKSVSLIILEVSLLLLLRIETPANDVF